MTRVNTKLECDERDERDERGPLKSRGGAFTRQKYLSRLTMTSITCKIASYRESYGKFTTNNDKLS